MYQGRKFVAKSFEYHKFLGLLSSNFEFVYYALFQIFLNHSYTNYKAFFYFFNSIFSSSV